MQSIFQDVRHGARLLLRNPGFSLAAIVTLGLGIGANSAIFSVVNALTLKPLPYHDPSRVTFVLGWDLDENEMRFNLHHADYLDLQRDAKSFQDLAGYTYLSANLTGGDIPDRVQAYRVTPNTFTMLGVNALVGRAFDARAVAGGRTDIAVISHALWQRRFGGDAGVIGRQIVVNDEPKEIVAVMPPRFEFPVFNFKGDLWVPSQLRGWERGQRAQFGGLTVVGRLRDGVAYAQAQSEVDLLMRGYAERYFNSNRGMGARVIEMGRLGDTQAGPAAIILLVTVAMVLLLACANVANLLLARGAARQRELAVRAAIGASRFRIGRQMFVEGALLAIGGGMFGVAIADVALAGLRASLPDLVLTTAPNVYEIGVDAATLGYTLAVSLLTSVIVGVLPAWRASRDRFDALKESASAGGGRGARRLRSVLVVGEVALATTLLVAAVLLARSYTGLSQVNPGFDPDGVMTMAMSLPESRYPEIETRDRFYEQVLARTMALPGVASAGFVNMLPFSTYDIGTNITVDGAPAPEPGRDRVTAFRVVSDRYFETMRIPAIGGRMFDRRDTRDAPLVAIINQVLAHRYFADRSAIGQRLIDNEAWSRLPRGTVHAGTPTPWLTIVGIVGDVRHSNLWDTVPPQVYLPMSQAAEGMMMLAARTPARPEDLTAPIRDAIRAIDPAQPVYHVKTLDTMVSESLELQRTSAALVTLFSAVALMLAAIGIYGVVSYGVIQQTREFGVRMALGATPRDVLHQVLRSGGTLVGVGVVVGIAGAAAVSGLLRGALFGVTPMDPLTYAGVAMVLGLAGVIACMVPARRASGTNPVDALRSE